jgi:hypothetical protein
VEFDRRKQIQKDDGNRRPPIKLIPGALLRRLRVGPAVSLYRERYIHRGNLLSMVRAK